MAIGSGLGGQLGIVEESTYGTYVAPTRFLEFNRESLEPDIVIVESLGIGGGRHLQTGRHKSYIRGANGSIEMDVMSKGFGLPLKHCLGSYANALVAGSEYKGTIQPDASGLAGLFLTCQVGRPDIGGTVRPFNYEGCKVTSWELKADVDDWLKLIMNLDAETEQTTDALASASYASAAEPFVFSEGALTINSVATRAKRFSIKGDNALDTDRRFLGNSKQEPIANGEFAITGELEFELEDLTRHGELVAGTEITDIVLTFTSPTTISGGGPFKIVITIAKAFWTGGTPKIGGPEVLGEPLQFKAVNDGTNPVIKIEYHSTDSAA